MLFLAIHLKHVERTTTSDKVTGDLTRMTRVKIVPNKSDVIVTACPVSFRVTHLAWRYFSPTLRNNSLEDCAHLSDADYHFGVSFIDSRRISKHYTLNPLILHSGGVKACPSFFCGMTIWIASSTCKCVMSLTVCIVKIIHAKTFLSKIQTL